MPGYRSQRRIPGFRSRRGKLLVLLAIMLPTLCGVISLVIDGGLLYSASRQVQHAADSAATAAAMEKQHGQSNDEARLVAERFVHEHNLFSQAIVTLKCPPESGSHIGSNRHVEIIVQEKSPTYFMHLLSGRVSEAVAARAVAGFESSTAGAAVVVLDPGPPPFSVPPLPTLSLLPPLPSIVGGLEVLGVGSVEVDGAVLVNTEWGGKDENGDQVGEPAGPLGLSHAVAATPLISLSKLRCRDLRVVGGVDQVSNYAPFESGSHHPLQAGRLPVPDPLKELPAPTTDVDPINVKTTTYGGKTVIGLPLISPPVVLQPGVYDWIEVISGRAIFRPGVYIIRKKNPLTQISLSIVAGQVQANGVMFYITDSTGYSPASGVPDSGDGESAAPLPAVANTIPAAVINIGLLGSSYRGLDDPSSLFNGMLVYQRRHDRRPIVIVQENLLGPGQFQGTIYSKWGHVILAGKGTYDTRLVAGTIRIIALLDMDIKPSVLLPAAEDVFLVE